MSNEKRHQSGSPAAWKLRKAQYRQHRVSNPGQPSPTNRKARRLEKRLVETALRNAECRQRDLDLPASLAAFKAREES